MPEFRKIAAPTLWKTPPPTLAPAAGGSRWEAFLRLVLRPLWGLRLEIGTATLALVGWSALSDAVGTAGAGVLLVIVVGVGFRWERVRRGIVVAFHRARLRRRFAAAVRYSGLATMSDRVPRPVAISSIPAGDLMRVKVPAGSNTGMLAASADTIAAYLGVRDVRVVRDPANAAYADVRVVACDPLAGSPAILWRNLYALRLSVWEAVPVGVDEDGEIVWLDLVEHNVLVGGEPGAGKSVAVSMLVATAALDPGVVLWLLDGKMVELAVWEGCAHRFVGADVVEAIDVLKELVGVVDERLVALKERRKRKVERGDGLALHVVVVDELAYYCRKPRPHGPEFSALLTDLVSRGRAAGVIVIAATQKPSHDTIPTALRDVIGFRWALRCSTRDGSDTILGAGWASEGYSAATIDAADRGVGFLRHEGGTPVRCKACYLSDADLEALAARAEMLRAGPTSEALATVLPLPSCSPDVNAALTGDHGEPVR